MARLLIALASVSLLQFGGSQRAEVINALSTALADGYLYEDVGKRLAEDLRGATSKSFSTCPVTSLPSGPTS